MLSLDQQTLNDLAYGRLKQSLISGTFKPGQVLVIRKLAADFGISTTPIREALQRLVAERMLNLQQNRSIAVPKLSVAGFSELSRIRCALEGLAAQMATPNFDRQSLSMLKADLDGMDVAIGSDARNDYLSFNERFHFRIYEHARAPLLLDMIRDLWGRVGPYMRYLMETETYVPQANTVHRRIVAALGERADALARLLVIEDISTAADILVGRLLADDRDGWIEGRPADKRPVHSIRKAGVRYTNL